MDQRCRRYAISRRYVPAGCASNDLGSGPVAGNLAQLCLRVRCKSAVGIDASAMATLSNSLYFHANASSESSGSPFIFNGFHFAVGSLEDPKLYDSLARGMRFDIVMSVW